MERKLLAGVMLVAVSGSLIAARRDTHRSAQQACDIQGVWNMVSYTYKGTSHAAGSTKSRKVVTKKYWMGITMDARRDTIPLLSALDSARHFAMSGGSGHYRVAGNKYTEQWEFFSDPNMLGKTMTATCRTEGGRWYHTYRLSDLSPQTTTPSRDSVTEVYIRAE
jgi:hypothetical protein